MAKISKFLTKRAPMRVGLFSIAKACCCVGNNRHYTAIDYAYTEASKRANVEQKTVECWQLQLELCSQPIPRDVSVQQLLSNCLNVSRKGC